MPWTMNDYPSSLKNLDKVVRKKAIDIANAMVEEGYSEPCAIPIATSQAEEWYNNANQDEMKAFANQGDPVETDEHYQARSALLDKREHVIPHCDGWAV